MSRAGCIGYKRVPRITGKTVDRRPVCSVMPYLGSCLTSTVSLTEPSYHEAKLSAQVVLRRSLLPVGATCFKLRGFKCRYYPTVNFLSIMPLASSAAPCIVLFQSSVLSPEMHYRTFYEAVDGSDLAFITGEATTKFSKVCLKIRSVFDAGVPFYTKDAIREVCQQIEKSGRKGEKISVRGLDGVPIQFSVHTGDVSSLDESDTESVVCVYHCPQFKTTRPSNTVT